MTCSSTEGANIYSLPNEILILILSHLDGRSLTRCTSVSTFLRNMIIPSDLSTPDLLWANLVSNLRLSTPAPYPSFRALYNALRCNLWLHGKVWYGDRQFSGYILISRYNPQNGALELTNLLATKREQNCSAAAAPQKRWTHDPNVPITDFCPRVRLWETPLLTITADTFPQEGEIRCVWIGGEVSCSRVRTRACHSPCPYPTWPPPLVPAKEHAHSNSTCPPSLTPSEQLFRLRKWVMFGGTPSAGGARIRPEGEGEGEIFSALDRNLYTPDEEHPYRGLWVGDFGASGCEFTLLHQPDRHGLEAIKITGDINVPRGEHAFHVADVNNPVRIANEPEWRGAKVFRARYQIAEPLFRHREFIDSEMICINSKEIAVLWNDSPAKALTRFRRVDVDEFVYGSGEIDFDPPSPRHAGGG